MKTYTVTNLIGAVASFELDTMSSSSEGYVYCNSSHSKYGERSLLMTGSADSVERTYVVRQKNVGYIKPSLISSHKYYARIEVYQTTAAGSVDLYWPIAEPSLFSGLSGPANQWNMLSTVVDRSSFSDGSYQFRVDYNNQGSTAYMWFDGLMLIDLTDTFGSGNEPSKDWCDANINFTTSTTTATWWDTELQPVARNISNVYVGVDGIARKITKGYVDVDGVARLFHDVSVDLITFYFIGVEEIAEAGMTWYEWFESSYNDVGIQYNSRLDAYTIGGTVVTEFNDEDLSTTVSFDSAIEAGHHYTY